MAWETPLRPQACCSPPPWPLGNPPGVMGPQPPLPSPGKCPDSLLDSLPVLVRGWGPSKSFKAPDTADPWRPLSVLHLAPTDWSPWEWAAILGAPRGIATPSFPRVLLSNLCPGHATSLASLFPLKNSWPPFSLSLSPCSGGRSLGEEGPPARGASSPTPPVSIKSERLSPAPGGPGDFPKTFPYPLLLARPLAEPLRPGPPMRRLPTADGWPR